jgi:uncharacterized membrane protein
MRIVGFGHGLLAIAVASLAVLSLHFHDFAPMWRAVPADVPWREGGVRLVALLLLAASVGLCFRHTALASAVTIGAYQVVWAVSGVPAIVSNPLGIGSWYPLCEALTSAAGTWILYATLRCASPGSGMPMASAGIVRAARAVFALTCIFYGSSHFAYADYTAGMVPAWLPARMGFTYFTGLSYVAAGVGIIVPVLPGLAATLVAIMMSAFGLLVWVPSFFAHPKPAWATPLQNEWSELEVNALLAAAAWIVAESLRHRAPLTRVPHAPVDSAP